MTEAEVLAIRDKCSTMAVPLSVAMEMEKSRGYPDIVAEDAWNEWQRVRTQFNS